MKYAVIYQSKSGNTKLLAEEIFNTIESEEKEIYDIDEGYEMPEADVYFVGFGIHNNSCSMDIADAMESIGMAKVVLFATCGYTPTDKYKEMLEKNLEVWLPEDAEYIDMFVCQGNVEPDRRQIMISQMPHVEDKLRQMFNMGCTHPNEEDLKAVSDFTRRILKQIFVI